MPRRCSVAGCRSNYDFTNPTSTFILPKDEPRRSQWLRKIPTDFSKVKSPIICIKHFREEDIIRKDCVVYKGEYRELDYVLLGKFQTDALEARFGAYRQMSGSNYYISFIQVIESERKLKFQSNLLISTNNRNIPLKSLQMDKEKSCLEYISISEFQDALVSVFSLEYIPKETLPILTYIGGYTARKVLKHTCDMCSFWLVTDKSFKVEMYSGTEKSVDNSNFLYKLVAELDRGKLVLPSETVVISVSAVWFVMNRIVSDFEEKFLSSKMQLPLLHKLCECKRTLKSLLENICLSTCKIMLNNFVKYKNDMLHSNKNSNKKLKKFSS